LLSSRYYYIVAKVIKKCYEIAEKYNVIRTLAGIWITERECLKKKIILIDAMKYLVLFGRFIQD